MSADSIPFERDILIKYNPFNNVYFLICISSYSSAKFEINFIPEEIQNGY